LDIIVKSFASRHVTRMRWGVTSKTSKNQKKMVIVPRGNSRTRKRVVFEGDRR